MVQFIHRSQSIPSQRNSRHFGGTRSLTFEFIVLKTLDDVDVFATIVGVPAKEFRWGFEKETKVAGRHSCGIGRVEGGIAILSKSEKVAFPFLQLVLEILSADL